jgi:hypothetical protein
MTPREKISGSPPEEESSVVLEQERTKGITVKTENARLRALLENVQKR